MQRCLTATGCNIAQTPQRLHLHGKQSWQAGPFLDLLGVAFVGFFFFCGPGWHKNGDSAALDSETKKTPQPQRQFPTKTWTVAHEYCEHLSPHFKHLLGNLVCVQINTCWQTPLRKTSSWISAMELAHIESRLYQPDRSAHSQICAAQSSHYFLPQASPAVRLDNRSFVQQFRLLASKHLPVHCWSYHFFCWWNIWNLQKSFLVFLNWIQFFWVMGLLKLLTYDGWSGELSTSSGTLCARNRTWLKHICFVLYLFIDFSDKSNQKK